MRWIVIFILAVVVAAYLVAGAFLFRYLERSTTEARNYTAEIVNFTQSLTARYPSLSEVEITHIIQDVLKAHGEGTFTADDIIEGYAWDIPSSFFFVVTVITTIGYGHLSPATVGGRVAVIFYGLFGIPLCLIFLSGLGEKLVLGFKRIEKCFACCSKCDHVCHIIRLLVLIAAGWIVFLIIPAAIFMYIEKWPYIDSLYYCFVTLSTIGFGDLVVSNQVANTSLYIALTVIWLFIGLAWLSSLISLMSEAMQKGFDEGEEKLEEEINHLGSAAINLEHVIKNKYFHHRDSKADTEIQHPEKTNQDPEVLTKL